jgi:hypothetical protein
MRGHGRLLTFAMLAATCGPPAMAQEFDPATLDLAALVECRADLPAYNNFAFWLAGTPDAAERLGWRQVETDNPFLQQYEMDRPVTVFGRPTQTIAFTSTGPMAVLDGVATQDLAGELGIVPVVSTGEKVLGEKVVAEKSETADGVTYATRISLNVSTVDTHPGKVLAGCSFALEVK